MNISRDTLKKISEIIAYSFIVLAMILFIASQYFFKDTLEDDAYISLRYADNFIQGKGLVFNPGERVEGYTNLLWVLLLAGTRYLGADLENSAMVLGAVSGILTLIAIARSSIFGTRQIVVNAMAVMLLAVNPAFQAEAAMGLETVFFTLIVFLALTSVSSGISAARWSCLTGFLTGLISWIRPEGIWMAAYASGFALIFSREQTRQIILKLVIPAFLMIALLTVFRLTYYGEWVPNTFAAKTAANWIQVERGIGYFNNFAGQYGWVALLLPLVLMLMFKFKVPSIVFLCGFVMLHCVFVISVGGDYKPSHRFFICLIPLLHLFLCGAVFEAFSVAIKKFNRSGLDFVFLPVIAVLLVYQFLSIPRFNSVNEFMEASHEKIQLDRLAGAWLRANAASDATLATEVIGRIPYYSGLTTYDMSGLTDKHIARVVSPMQGILPAGHDKTDAAYILGREPDYILFHSIIFTNFPYPSLAGRQVNYYESELWKLQVLHEIYRLQSAELIENKLFFNFYMKKRIQNLLDG